jgi:hypothetical protein
MWPPAPRSTAASSLARLVKPVWFQVPPFETAELCVLLPTHTLPPLIHSLTHPISLSPLPSNHLPTPIPPPHTPGVFSSFLFTSWTIGYILDLCAKRKEGEAKWKAPGGGRLPTVPTIINLFFIFGDFGFPFFPPFPAFLPTIFFSFFFFYSTPLSIPSHLSSTSSSSSSPSPSLSLSFSWNYFCSRC